MGGLGNESASGQRGQNRSFMCTFRANNALFSSVIRCYTTKYKPPFKPKKGLKFQYFPVVSRRDGILECPFFLSARSSRAAAPIVGDIMAYLLPFVKDKRDQPGDCER